MCMCVCMSPVRHIKWADGSYRFLHVPGPVQQTDRQTTVDVQSNKCVDGSYVCLHVPSPVQQVDGRNLCVIACTQPGPTMAGPQWTVRSNKWTGGSYVCLHVPSPVQQMDGRGLCVLACTRPGPTSGQTGRQSDPIACSVYTRRDRSEVSRSSPA